MRQDHTQLKHVSFFTQITFVICLKDCNLILGLVPEVGSAFFISVTQNKPLNRTLKVPNAGLGAFRFPLNASQHGS